MHQRMAYALDRETARFLRKRNRGPFYRRPIFWTCNGLSLVLGLPFAVVGVMATGVALVCDSVLQGGGWLLTRLEWWAYPGLKTVPIRINPRWEDARRGPFH